MTSDERKQLAEDCKRAINQAMVLIHQQWSKRCPQEELRLHVCRILSDRAFECALESVEKGMRPNRKLDTLIGLMKAGKTASEAAQITEDVP